MLGCLIKSVDQGFGSKCVASFLFHCVCFFFLLILLSLFLMDVFTLIQSLVCACAVL